MEQRRKRGGERECMREPESVEEENGGKNAVEERGRERVYESASEYTRGGRERVNIPEYR